MLTIENEREEKLIKSVRKMSPVQIDSLLSFINTLVETDERKIDAKHEFLKTIQEISQKAQERGLTEEILNEILTEYDKGS
ncbi:MAG: hypothetical protein JWQ09_4362 [Segetibacter sp.]|nr:hypothetical protein [Segetibacter sp.]